MIHTILSIIFWIWIIQSAAVLLMYCRAMFAKRSPAIERRCTASIPMMHNGY